MTKVLIAFISVCCCYSAFAQGHRPPAEGMAVVYFIRASNYQMRISFDYYDGDQLIASFQGRQYFRYECKPGKHLFWASSSNRDFLEADLKANSSYVVVVEPSAGAGIPNVALTPIHENHKFLHKAKWLVVNLPSVVELDYHLKDESKRMSAFIQKTLSEYKEQKQSEKILTADMAIPPDKLK